MKNESSVGFPLLRVLVLLVFTGSLAFGQLSPHRQRNKARPAHPHSSAKTKFSELLRLAEKLRAQGATVLVTKEMVSQPFFSVGGRVININGESVQVFEYATPPAANANASRVSADGTTIGTSKPSWMAPPHFFRSAKLIVLYVGANQAVMDLLRTTLGYQFAGG